MDSDTVYKNRLGQRLTIILLDAYEQGIIPVEQVAYLAGLIRTELEAAKSSSEVFTFIESLAEEWDIFKSVLQEPQERIVKNVHRRWLEQLTK